MPHSSEEGKRAVTEIVRDLRPQRVLDIGAGSGTYARLLRPLLPVHAWIVGVEVWQPYFEEYELDALYDRILWNDVRALRADLYRAYDLVIFGDVLEHLELEDAIWVWNEARSVTNVVASVPNREWPQGAEYGNPHEEHRWSATTAEFEARFGGIVETHVDGDISVYRGVRDDANQQQQHDLAELQQPAEAQA